ncbi:uncharacterized protein LOC135135572 [Zophobas morio]|uniref:uncharacterized protein LOC135135572 n=1 Tax=Zophobas morio TaxID=2755281 RepID=UPI003082DF5B
MLKWCRGRFNKNKTQDYGESKSQITLNYKVHELHLLGARYVIYASFTSLEYQAEGKAYSMKELTAVIHIRHSSTGFSNYAKAVAAPDDIHDGAKVASQFLVPIKTGSRYQKEYEDFISWRKSKEEILLPYWSDLSSKFVPNSLLSKLSMLKTCLKLHKNVDTSGYGKLFTLLKRKSKNYKPKKVAVLNEEQVT